MPCSENLTCVNAVQFQVQCEEVGTTLPMPKAKRVIVSCAGTPGTQFWIQLVCLQGLVLNLLYGECRKSSHPSMGVFCFRKLFSFFTELLLPTNRNFQHPSLSSDTAHLTLSKSICRQELHSGHDPNYAPFLCK